MAEEKIPEKLYKYRVWPSKYTEDILVNNRIYLNSIVDFNDPFENYIKFDMSCTRKEFLARLTEALNNEYNRGEYNKITYKKCFEEIKKIKNLSREEFKDFSKKHEQFYKEEMEEDYKKVGVSCFSKNKDNILMWSHYADSHKGICLEFSTSKKMFRPKKVVYEDVYPVLNYYHLSLDERIVYSFFTKAKDWEYEQEYRFVKVEASKSYVCFESRVLAGLICGCKMDCLVVDELIESLKKRETPVTLYRAKKKDREFGLDIEPIGQYGGTK